MFYSRHVCFYIKHGVVRAVTPILIIHVPIQGVNWTFKHGMFRVGGFCNFPILCAHFLYSIKRHSFEIRSFLEDVKQKQPQMLNQYLNGRISRGDSVDFGSTIK